MDKKPLVATSTEILRYIDPTRKVLVYRNLHRQCLSIRQDAIVRCHTKTVSLKDCQFIVGKAGQERVRRERRKNVHAYVKGFIVSRQDYTNLLPFEWDSVYYNPYTTDYWTDSESNKYVTNAQWAEITTSYVAAFNGPYLP